jgi:drug/metabolite transporter (DMT)-like permease
MQNTTLGVAIMLVATTLTNVGAVMQKKAVDGMPAFDKQPILDSLRSVLGTPLWLVGWLLATFAIVLNMVALGLADISIIQPLNGFGLVVLAVVSRFYLGERLGTQALFGMGAIVLGVGLVGLLTPESRIFVASDELYAVYTHGGAAATLLALVGFVVALVLLARSGKGSAGILFALAAASCSVLGLTFAKGYFGLLAVTSIGATLADWPSYLLLLPVIACSTGAMALQQLSFQKGRAVVVTPVFAATSVLLPLLTGRMVFGEQLAVASLVAASLIVVGVVLLGARQPAATPTPETVEVERAVS